ncbi:MAG: AbrB/MazE/SpoVT family DNA-binding domain-containing protein [Nanoarchaeota archaeon]
MTIQTKTKRWGNSIGIIIPSETVDKLNIQPEDEVVIEIEKIEKKGNVLREMFGTLKSKKTARQMVNETRKELESKWMK